MNSERLSSSRIDVVKYAPDVTGIFDFLPQVGYCSRASGVLGGMPPWLVKRVCPNSHRLLPAAGFDFRFHLRKLAVQPRHRRLELSDLVSGSGKITTGCVDLILCLARQPGQRLLKKLDIGLQASGTTLHVLFGGADFQPANVLRYRGRQQCDEQCSRRAQNLRRAEPKWPKLRLFAFHG